MGVVILVELKRIFFLPIVPAVLIPCVFLELVFPSFETVYTSIEYGVVVCKPSTTNPVLFPVL